MSGIIQLGGEGGVCGGETKVSGPPIGYHFLLEKPVLMVPTFFLNVLKTKFHVLL